MRRSEERMRRFLGDASHELRTPLASIAGYEELMNAHRPHRTRSGLAPGHRRVGADDGPGGGPAAVAGSTRAGRLQSAEVDLAALLAEAVWDARAAGTGHEWQLQLSLDAPALVVGDEARLHQVLANLLANARMHTPVGTTGHGHRRGHGQPYRHPGTRRRPRHPPALLPAVFERFTRADASRARAGGKEGGSGLGLAIAAAITGAHGGRIDVTSVPGRTEFTIELPAAAELPPAETAIRRPHGAGLGEHRTPADASSKVSLAVRTGLPPGSLGVS